MHSSTYQRLLSLAIVMCCGCASAPKPLSPPPLSPSQPETSDMTDAATAAQATGYRLPPDEVVKLIDADPTPFLRKSPDGRYLLQVHYTAMPPLELVAQPFDKLAGLRINSQDGTERKLYNLTRMSLQTLPQGSVKELELPTHGKRLSTVSWSDDSRHVGFTLHTDKGLELWVIEIATGKARRLSDALLQDAIGAPFSFTSAQDKLIIRTAPASRGAKPQPPLVPTAPIIEESFGQKAQNRTYQDLLQTPYDDALFRYYTLNQLEVVDLKGQRRALGKPGIYTAAITSPDDRYLLVKRLKEPFSHAVPLYRFAHTLEVWDMSTGEIIATIADLPAAEQVPIEGVSLGPRSMRWDPLSPATLVWVEALDGGDPATKADFRDQIMRLEAPFKLAEAKPMLKVVHRYRGMSWLETPGKVWVSDYDRDKRWTTTKEHDLSQPDAPPRTIFDRSVRDQYNDPGSPLYTVRPNGTVLIHVDQGHVYLEGQGASPEGNRPFLDKMSLAELKAERLFESGKEVYASFSGFGPEVNGAKSLIIRSESVTLPPNYHLQLPDQRVQQLTSFPDPHPQLTGIKKKLLTYKRADGVPLSGMLYLPPDYKEGQNLPLVIWAYPREFNDAKTAGQVRAAPNRFTRLGGTSPLMFLTQGYAVLDDATIPIVGDPETMNDTFVEQIVTSAQAAIDAVVAEGVTDGKRVGIAGHSYGAFMVANLMAHSNLFKAGIARSGAYNRTLTPFGFQGERRTMWQAPKTYVEISPLFVADKIKDPILLIHGEDDDNSGTYPLQTQRLFHALKGLGGQARMVMLPKESHGYYARESVLHVLAESFDWFDRFVKNGDDAAKPQEDAPAADSPAPTQE